jgi:hypothetical protein
MVVRARYRFAGAEEDAMAKELQSKSTSLMTAARRLNTEG